MITGVQVLSEPRRRHTRPSSDNLDLKWSQPLISIKSDSSQANTEKLLHQLWVVLLRVWELGHWVAPGEGPCGGCPVWV